MLKKILILLSLLTIALAATTGFAQDPKAQVIQTARALETNPLDKETIKMREAALRWVIETDQVQVGLCGGIAGLFADKKNKYRGEMTAGYTIGMAAFKLENPGKASDEYSAQLAGLESALKMYEAIIKAKPKDKNDTVEALLVKRDKGELAAIVNATDCSKH